MIRSGFCFKTIGLCALVLGTMAIVASGAQATAGANWMVSGANIEGTKTAAIAENLEIEELKSATDPGKHLVLLTKILNILTHILCTAAAIKNANLIKEGGISNAGKVRFSGCVTKLAEKTSTPCLPKTAGVNDVIETNAGKGLLILVGGVGETEITSTAGGPLATIESSEECAVGQKINIEGKLVLKDCINIKEENEKHLIEVDNTASTLTASKQKAEIHGSAFIKLVGTPPWSGLPA